MLSDDCLYDLWTRKAEQTLTQRRSSISSNGLVFVS
jgi:hypothetical protein